MDDMMSAFLAESREMLAKIDSGLLALEKDAASPGALADVFRALHTVKGNCAFVGLKRLEEVAHAGETLLSRLRSGERAMNPEVAACLLATVDAMRAILQSVESSGREPDEQADLVGRLRALAAGGPESGPASPSTPPVVGLDSPRAAADTAVRVDLTLLDGLMTLIGELVLTRNRLLLASSGREDPDLISIAQRLDAITADLQENALKTRMHAVEAAWSRIPRLVRDLALACGKKVRLETEGGDTELDRTLIEAIRDPLTHVIRNAVDHGLESPERRVALGKSPEGVLRIRAGQVGGQVRIEISDDGAGLDAEKIRAKAIALGLFDAAKAARMSREELHDLIFLPGFSTADKVSRISGRGVGMDVVKENIEKVGGSVDLESVAGSGTVIKIRIPLTLAIVPAFVAACGGQRYAIPRRDIAEILRLREDAPGGGVERIHDAPVYRLRGRLIPVVFLAQAFGLSDSQADAGQIVVLQSGESRFGVAVDDILSSEEIVVRPLASQIRETSVFAGSTIMGDGRVVLILDTAGLAKLARLADAAEARAAEESSVLPARAEERVRLFLASARDGGRMAIEASRVARLERFERRDVERVGDVDMVKYRGAGLPLVEVSRVLSERRKPPRGLASDVAPSEFLHAVVCESDGLLFGVVVDGILDIVEESLASRRPASRAGVLFTAVVRDRVTEILDVETIARAGGALPGERRRSAP